jgi:hypothetical protein
MVLAANGFKAPVPVRDREYGTRQLIVDWVRFREYIIVLCAPLFPNQVFWSRSFPPSLLT